MSEHTTNQKASDPRRCPCCGQPIRQERRQLFPTPKPAETQLRYVKDRFRYLKDRIL